MLSKYLEKYMKRFGEAFPMFQIARGKQDREIVEIIKSCLKNNKNAYEMGYAVIDEDVLY